jgi:hypothetical protein
MALSKADSSSKCNHALVRLYLFHKYFMRRFEAKALSRSMIEVVYDRLDVGASDSIEGHLFWKKLTNQPVHVFVGPPFPGTIWVSKIELRVDAFGNALVV